MYPLLWLGACVGAAAALAGPNASHRIAWPNNDGNGAASTAGGCGVGAQDSLAAGTAHPDGAQHLPAGLAAGADGTRYPSLVRPAPQSVPSTALKALQTCADGSDFCPCGDSSNPWPNYCFKPVIGGCWTRSSCPAPYRNCSEPCPMAGSTRADGCCTDPNAAFSDVGPVTVLENSNIVMIQSASIYAEIQATRQGPCDASSKRSATARAVTAVLRECKDLDAFQPTLPNHRSGCCGGSLVRQSRALDGRYTRLRDKWRPYTCITEVPHAHSISLPRRRRRD